MGHEKISQERTPEHETLYTSEHLPASLSDVVRGKLSRLLPTIADRAAQEKVRTVLRTMQTELAMNIKRECAGPVKFSSGALIKSGETTPDDCALRLLETIPLYHILVGSSFYLSTLRERREMLERLNVPDIGVWQERATSLVEGALDQLLPKGNSGKKHHADRRQKR